MNTNTAAEITLDRICGSVTVIKLRKRFMPRLRATISWV